MGWIWVLKSTFSALERAGNKAARAGRMKRIATPYAGITGFFHAVSVYLW